MAGIPTVSITVWRQITEQVNPPRAAFVRNVFGAPLGEPGDAEKQRSLLRDTLRLLAKAERPGITELPYAWRHDPDMRARQNLD